LFSLLLKDYLKSLELFIDGKLVVDNDGVHGANEKEGEIALKKGMHQIELLYFQAGGGKALHVFIKSNDNKKTEVTKDILWY